MVNMIVEAIRDAQGVVREAAAYRGQRLCQPAGERRLHFRYPTTRFYEHGPRSWPRFLQMTFQALFDYSNGGRTA